jgi:GR25 family glycosyltransferase involved in LPS biosynthesis
MDNQYDFKLKDLNVLYINLDRRPDRNEYMENELCRLGLNGVRISAVDGITLTNEEKTYWIDNNKFNTITKNTESIYGQIGRYLSHLKTLKYAADNNIENLLILEDDCKFLSEHNDISICVPANTDIFYLGGLFWYKSISNGENDYTFENFKDTLYFHPNIQIFTNYFRICGSFAYILPSREHIIKLLTTLITSTKKTIDMMFIGNIQKNTRCFIIQPSLCIKTTQFKSDISYSDKPKSNTYFYNMKIYTIPRVIEFYNNNYHKVLKRLTKYYLFKKKIPNPDNLYKDLRIVAQENIS